MGRQWFLWRLTGGTITAAQELPEEAMLNTGLFDQSGGLIM
jgi:hypothetical protein